MTVPVIVAVVFIIAWPVLYLVLHHRWPRRFPLGPLGWLLERIPAPSWPALRMQGLRMPRLGGILDKLTVPLRYARRPAGEHARPLTIRFRVGGELPDGTFLHGGDTGPMPAADWDAATPFPQAALPGTEAAP